MKTARKPRRLVCLKCDGETFAEAQGEIAQEFRGETLRVCTPVMRCAACGWETLGPGQVDKLRVATADAYRRRRGLLASTEIRAIRESAGLGQRAFAAALDVGEASIPRWESWQVQEAVYDERIRRFAERLAQRPLPTLKVLIEHKTMPIVGNSWQDAFWTVMAKGLHTNSPQASLPGMATFERRTIVHATQSFSLSDFPDLGAELEDDTLCAHR